MSLDAALRRRLLSSAAVLAAAGHLVVTTWRQWGGLHPDCARSLLLPKEILEGRRLYEEVIYTYGPLTPHVNALLYRLFGVRVETLFAAGITTALLTAFVLLALARRLLPEALAALTSIAFLYLLAFANYNWTGIFNFVMPYTFAATYGLLLSLLSVYFLVRHFETGRGMFYWLSCLLLGLTLLTKQEIAAALAATHVLSYFLRPFRPGRLMVLAAGLAPAACIYGYYLARLGFGGLVFGNLFPPGVFGVRSQSLNMGADSPGTNARLLAESLAATWGLCLTLILLERWRLHLKKTVLGRGAGRLAGAGVLFAEFLAVLWAAGFLSPGWISGPLGLFNQYRSLPLLVLIVFASLSIRRASAPRPESSRECALLITAFAGLLLARKLLDCNATHYGFFLLPPGLILYHYFYFEFVPSIFPYAAPLRSGAGRGMLGLFFGLLAAQHVFVSRHHYEGHTEEFSTRFGAMRLLAGNYGRTYRSAIRFLETQTPPSATVLVVPDGLSLNFFADRPRVLPLEIFAPYDLETSASVDKLIAAIDHRSPDYLAFPHGPGDRLGLGPSAALVGFFEKRYRLIQTFDGSQPGSFAWRINLFKRVPSAREGAPEGSPGR